MGGADVSVGWRGLLKSVGEGIVGTSDRVGSKPLRRGARTDEGD